MNDQNHFSRKRADGWTRRDFLKFNGEAIYSTSATCFGEELGKGVKTKDGYGRDTEVSSANAWRSTTKLGKISLIIFKWPRLERSRGLDCKAKSPRHTCSLIGSMI